MGRPGTPRRVTPSRSVLGAVALALIPWSTAFADTTPPHRSALRTALADVRARGPARGSTFGRSGQATAPATHSAAFFKTRTGIVVAIVMGVGAGYAIYSTHHDRIHSPGKN